MSQQINLFNPIFLKQKKYFSTVAMAQALAALAIGCALLSAYAGYQAKSLTREVEATNTQLVATQAQLGRVVAEFGPRPKSASLEQEILAAEKEVQGLQQVVNVLKHGELGNTDGYSEYLRAFARQGMEGVWLTGLNIEGAGVNVSVQGRALRPELVPTYMNRLKREPILQGKSFETLEMSAPRDTSSGAFLDFNLH